MEELALPFPPVLVSLEGRRAEDVFVESGIMDVICGSGTLRTRPREEAGDDRGASRRRAGAAGTGHAAGGIGKGELPRGGGVAASVPRVAQPADRHVEVGQHPLAREIDGEGAAEAA